jgi:adenosylcobyric acid synthase
VETRFGAEKVLARPRRTLADGTTVAGYQIHHGIVSHLAGDPFFADEGCRVDSVAGTSWHGLFENDEFRRGFLTDVALQAGRAFVASPGVCFADIRDARFETLADLVADHVDTEALLRLIEGQVEPRAPMHITTV